MYVTNQDQKFSVLSEAQRALYSYLTKIMIFKRFLIFAGMVNKSV